MTAPNTSPQVRCVPNSLGTHLTCENTVRPCVPAKPRTDRGHIDVSAGQMCPQLIGDTWGHTAPNVSPRGVCYGVTPPRDVGRARQ